MILWRPLSPNSIFGASAARLTLYANRLVLHGADAMETVPLAQLAAVRVAFERDPRKLNWAIVLLRAALVFCRGISGPLQGWMAARRQGRRAARRESLDAVLLAVFTRARPPGAAARADSRGSLRGGARRRCSSSSGSG